MKTIKNKYGGILCFTVLFCGFTMNACHNPQSEAGCQIDSLIILYNVRDAFSTMNYYDDESIEKDSKEVYYPAAFSSCVTSKDSLLMESLTSILAECQTSKRTVKGMPDYRIIILYSNHSYDSLDVFPDENASSLVKLIESVIKDNNPLWEKKKENGDIIIN